jgi:hypothetical protein
MKLNGLRVIDLSQFLPGPQQGGESARNLLVVEI